MEDLESQSISGQIGLKTINENITLVYTKKAGVVIGTSALLRYGLACHPGYKVYAESEQARIEDGFKSIINDSLVLLVEGGIIDSQGNIILQGFDNIDFTDKQLFLDHAGQELNSFGSYHETFGTLRHIGVNLSNESNNYSLASSKVRIIQAGLFRELTLTPKGKILFRNNLLNFAYPMHIDHETRLGGLIHIFIKSRITQLQIPPIIEINTLAYQIMVDAVMLNRKTNK